MKNLNRVILLGAVTSLKHYRNDRFVAGQDVCKFTLSVETDGQAEDFECEFVRLRRHDVRFGFFATNVTVGDSIYIEGRLQQRHDATIVSVAYYLLDNEGELEDDSE